MPVLPALVGSFTAVVCRADALVWRGDLRVRHHKLLRRAGARRAVQSLRATARAAAWAFAALRSTSSPPRSASALSVLIVVRLSRRRDVQANTTVATRVRQPTSRHAESAPGVSACSARCFELRLSPRPSTWQAVFGAISVRLPVLHRPHYRVLFKYAPPLTSCCLIGSHSLYITLLNFHLPRVNPVAAPAYTITLEGSGVAGGREGRLHRARTVRPLHSLGALHDFQVQLGKDEKTAGRFAVVGVISIPLCRASCSADC